ncbi:osmoprotectant ABC transporter substrate-binding protein [Enterococcus florum]|uniref:Osmoprotectant ABC transporter substrate-binding protein n=1 Tax=Enterococcus florum TaxID=2480627 RepID=A0A4P5PP02_9ENTE|nr:osmoprotectant ABC transporter substrate-binding protein [Enterococcus florum]GCF94873.1 osmoprotectant ABC transporter substrate-binding protein [Enterococcus florum]
MIKKIALSAGLILLSLFLAIRGFSNQTEETITVSGGVTSESQIIGNMIVELLKAETDHDVKFLNNLVSAQVNQVAMERKELSIASVRYTGTDLVTTLGLPIIKEPEKALSTVQKEFQERYQQTWFPSYGFANQFTFMVTRETAEKYQLEKVSDLQTYAGDFTLGTDQGWYERENDGYQAFSKMYGMDFKRVFPMQIGLLYDAVYAGEFDVILGYSTDGRISAYDLVMLEDDRVFFPPYTCSMVVDNDVLKRYPDIQAILSRLNGKIDTETMQRMNYQSDGERIEPKIVAQQFLEKHNYFREDK